MKIKRQTEIEVNINDIQVGDAITVKLKDGEVVDFLAADINEDIIIFLAQDCVSRNREMNRKDDNEGGYDKSDMRKYLNEQLINLFPDDLVSQMIPIYDKKDLLTILSREEAFGEIELLKNPRHRIAMESQIEESRYSAVWWLRDAVSASYFAYVGADGGATYAYASDPWVGIRPAFAISRS